jgi:chaperonin GroEL
MIKFNSESREALKAGIDALANAVKVTLGPKGRNVIIDQNGTPHVTKDGVTVAKAVKLEDKFENLGAQLIKQAAEHTADEVGDATTTSTVLAQYIINEGIKHIVAGANPMDLKRGIDKGVDYVVAKLKSLSREVDNSKIEQVATISANNDNTIGKLIAEAMAKVNNEGVITVEEAKGTDTYVDVVEGMQFDRGYISAYFISNTDKMLVELENPYILITNKKISTMKEMMGILEPVAQDGKSLLIIADDVDGEALSALVVNKLRGTLKIAAVKAPGFGDRRKDLLEDIAALTGATVVSTDKGMSLENADVKVLGSAARVTISKENTTIVDGNGNKELINSRIEQIRTRLTDTKDEIEKDNLTERLAKLAGGVAVMYVGAATEVEMKEKKDRVDDALAATRAAVEEGIVAGGGSTLLYLSNDLLELKGDNDDQTAGIRILYKALQEPIRQIANNAGQEGSVILQNVKNYNNPEMGYNAKTGEYVNMYLAGIIDPTKANRVSLENAASVATMFLTTECAIA